MPPCLTCPNPTRPSPGALYCPECHAAHRARNKWVYLTPDADLPQRPWPTAEHDWTTGAPNVTCPACQGAYHYGAPGPFTHLCPLCNVWLCWRETDEIVTKTRVGRTCSMCGGPVTLRTGKYGDFYSCDRYPTCKGKGTSRTVEYQAPRLALARWEPYHWTEMDYKAQESEERAERIEGFEAWIRAIRWKGRR